MINNYCNIILLLWTVFFRGDEWGKRREQNCFSETEPITKGRYRHRATDDQLMKIITATIDGLRQRGIKAQIIDITQLSEYRKDGHPSIYRKQWEPLTEEQLSNPKSYADCIHWCLPGVPDAWNELLYAYIFSRWYFQAKEGNFCCVLLVILILLFPFLRKECEENAPGFRQ